MNSKADGFSVFLVGKVKERKDIKAMEYMKARYEVKADAAQPKVARQPKKLEHTWGKYVSDITFFRASLSQKNA